MRIEICGGIGAGKTTLAQSRIATYKPVLENFRENPFSQAFYANPGQHAFETEMTFLLQHYHLVKLAGETPIICDFSFTQDLAFARMGLTGKKLRIFEETAAECLADIGPAIAVIHIECTASILAERIIARGRPEEASVPIEFLTKLNTTLAAELDECQLKIVRIGEHIDFRIDTDEMRRISKLLEDL